eukprot:11428512-Alexandrium_andersonii.AAC.1
MHTHTLTQSRAITQEPARAQAHMRANMQGRKHSGISSMQACKRRASAKVRKHDSTQARKR